MMKFMARFKMQRERKISNQDSSAKQIHASDESWNTGDDETLADKQKRLKSRNRTSRKGGKRVQREWEEIILESRDQKIELLVETRPALLSDILEKNMSIVNMWHLYPEALLTKNTTLLLLDFRSKDSNSSLSCTSIKLKY
nr:unnamed protein product [Callosobruchus analis]